MKNILITILALISSASFVHAAPDCMDTSNDLNQKIDYKDLHYVACNHNCYEDPAARLVENRGKCSVCGHYHMPRPLVVVKTADPTSVQTPTQKHVKKNHLARLFSRKNQ